MAAHSESFTGREGGGDEGRQQTDTWADQREGFASLFALGRSRALSLSFHFFFLSLLTFIFPDCISRLFRASQHRPARISRSVDTDRSPPSLSSDAKRAGNVIYISIYLPTNPMEPCFESHHRFRTHILPLSLFLAFSSEHILSDWLATNCDKSRLLYIWSPSRRKGVALIRYIGTERGIAQWVCHDLPEKFGQFSISLCVIFVWCTYDVNNTKAREKERKKMRWKTMWACFGLQLTTCVVNRKCGSASSHVGSMWNNAFRRHAKKRNPATWFRIVWIQSNRWIGPFRVWNCCHEKLHSRASFSSLAASLRFGVAETSMNLSGRRDGITAVAITRSRNFKNPISQHLFRRLTENGYLIEFELAIKMAIKKTERNMRNEIYIALIKEFVHEALPPY